MDTCTARSGEGLRLRRGHSWTPGRHPCGDRKPMEGSGQGNTNTVVVRIWPSRAQRCEESRFRSHPALAQNFLRASCNLWKRFTPISTGRLSPPPLLPLPKLGFSNHKDRLPTPRARQTQPHPRTFAVPSRTLARPTPLLTEVCEQGHLLQEASGRVHLKHQPEITRLSISSVSLTGP